ncbi:hypothetical protein Bra3105_00025 [Brachybacterium halotolerans subsp. kimchii]|uniref:helicase-related protein n=1 Tax=Brachybacterium halotolerans TaxID=2795215 RepID=UPI001E3A91DA|nr:helicase-related protein [Brachybacterium halotolerans]UEJ82760.1 hypothetical protein Bra3105_00025 [Brachybacterium halotolerans subsp. kimchii]
MAAIRVVRTLETEDRAANSEEQKTLAAFSGWGAVDGVFSGRPEWEAEASELRDLLTGEEWQAARANTLNAHFTDPEISRAMWDVMGEVGLPEDAVLLEPGAGTGTFLGQRPEGVSMIGVELDPLTALIGHYLHPQAQIRNEGFESTRVRPGMVDGAIGNVPYGSYALHDAEHNPARLSIHNHFIAKALDATRPGGLVSVVTSAWTLDGQDSTARRELAKRADLVAGARLPGAAFSRVAGTDVTTDVLVFRRLESERAVPNLETLDWGRTSELDQGVAVNEFFSKHPERVLGSLTVTAGRFGPQASVTDEQGDLPSRLREELAGQIRARGVTGGFAPRAEPLALEAEDTEPGLFEALPAHEVPVLGTVVATSTRADVSAAVGDFAQWTGTDWEKVKVPRARASEVRTLLDVRDAALSAVRTQTDTSSSQADREQARHRLNIAYDTYVGEHGPINRFELVTSAPAAKKLQAAVERAENQWRRNLPDWMSREERESEDPGNHLREQWRAETLVDLEGTRKRQPHLADLKTDPSLGLVMGLELFDEETQEARKSALFSEDIVSASTQERTAQSVDDAVAICMDETQSVSVDRVAALLGQDVDQARDSLAGVAYTDPETGRMLPAAIYLSGNVRHKLEVAREAAQEDASLAGNVTALEGVIPEWIGIADINLQPGINVLGPDEYRTFVRDTFKVEADVVYDEREGTWEVKSPGASAFPEDVAYRWGTQERRPTDLLQATMNQRPVVVRSRDADGKQVVDQQATNAARAKCEALTEEFTRWVADSPERSALVEERWNATFNQYVAPDYRSLGDRMSLPGLSGQFTPRWYQREGVARILHEPATLLNHVVGAGKTGTMVMGAMELRRTGTARKPWVVVPNHLVEQFSREANEWYPGARVLAIPSGVGPAERQRWIARSAGEDWDMVICPQSTFKLIGVDPARAHSWTMDQLAQIEDGAGDIDPKDRMSVKRFEGVKKRLEERVKKLEASKDVGLTFENTGCDFLMVDEAHTYKNLARQCDISDLSHAGSDQASDLDMKLQVLREFRRDVAERDGTLTPGWIPHVAAFATGTPVANNLAEMWVMQRYVRPDLLESQGTAPLREWARAFARSSQALEMSPDGNSWRMKDRVRSFTNLHALTASTRVFTSTVTSADLGNALPNLAGGQRNLLTRPASEQVEQYVVALGARAQSLSGDQREDNLLKINGDGRAIAIDPRLRGLDADEDGGRLGQIADGIIDVHDRSKDTRYVDTSGRDEAIPGALQLVFLDQGTPGGAGPNLYEDLRVELVARGMERERVAFIHDATDDESRGELFARCRDGRVNVLVGSTEKMGTGVNVQKRAIALWHADVPWRPADLEQREGRVLRQGNQNAEVTITNCVTQRTPDALNWQGIERKASFIAQITSGHAPGNDIDAGDDLQLSAGQWAAIAADNPLVMERAELTSELMTLESLAQAHRSSVLTTRARLTSSRANLTRMEQSLAELEDIGGRVDLEAGYVAPDGTHEERWVDASVHMRWEINTHLPRVADSSTGAAAAVGRIAGVDVELASPVRGVIVLRPVDAPLMEVGVNPAEDGISANYALRVANRLEKIPEKQARLREGISTTSQSIRELEEVTASMRFEQQEQLDSARARLEEIDKELEGTNDDDEEQGKVFREDLKDAGISLTIRGSAIRPGDVVRADGKRLSLTAERDEESELIRLVRPDGDVEKFAQPWDEVKLVARDRAQLTAWEARLIDRGERDRLVHPGGLPEGAQVVFADESGAVMEGVIESAGHPATARTSDGDEKVLLPGVMVLQPDYYDDEALAVRREWQKLVPANALVPGDRIVRALGQQDGEVVELPAWAGARAEGSVGAYLALPDGGSVSGREGRFEVEAGPGADADQLARSGMPTHLEITALRPGDVVARREVDRDATTDTPVTVISPADSWSRSAETRIRLEDGNIATVRTKSSSVVDVLSRSLTTMPAADCARLLEGGMPEGVHVIEHREISEHEGRQLVTKDAGQIRVGTIVKNPRNPNVPADRQASHAIRFIAEDGTEKVEARTYGLDADVLVLDNGVDAEGLRRRLQAMTSAPLLRDDTASTTPRTVHLPAGVFPGADGGTFPKLR